MTHPKPAFVETLIEAKNVRSLVWSGDSLVDWASGGVTYRLDGSSTQASVCYSYPFDAATTAPGSEYAVIYQTLGTKALLLKNGQIVRELNRSFYHADDYEYPVCLLRHGARTLLVHCPEEYNRLEIEDAETGEKLTLRTSEPADFFHSRLQASPGGARLLSAGWVWSPWDAVVFFDVAEALRRPEHLDELDGCMPTSRHVGLAEESSACWQTDTTVIITGGSEPEDPEEAAEATATERLRPCGIAVHNISSDATLSSCVLDTPPGTVLPVDRTHVVAFYDHPRLIRLADGAVEHTWATIASGVQVSSILCRKVPPTLALDPHNARFAIVQADGIHVVALQPPRAVRNLA